MICSGLRTIDIPIGSISLDTFFRQPRNWTWILLCLLKISSLGHLTSGTEQSALNVRQTFQNLNSETIQEESMSTIKAVTLRGELDSQLSPDFRGSKANEELIILSDLFQRENWNEMQIAISAKKVLSAMKCRPPHLFLFYIWLHKPE